MEETYEEIVRKWYMKMRGNFMDILISRYGSSNLRLADVENIYQDVFIAIHKNLNEGRINPALNWQSYIIRIGLNMASKKYRSIRRFQSIELPGDNDDVPSTKIDRISQVEETLQKLDDRTDLERNPEAKALMGDELQHTHEPCASIIRMTYYNGLKDSEIAGLIEPYRSNGKPSATNAKAIKARRWLCMRDLKYRVKLALYNAGIIDEKPVKSNRNGN